MESSIPEQLVTLLPRLRRFAYSLTGSLEDADDVVQSACERALGRLDQFIPGSRLDSWMYRIVQTTWIDRLRYSGRRSEVHAPDLVESLPFDARIQEQTEARAELAIVRAEVANLPEEQRIVLGLVTIDGRSYREAADILRVPVGTVMSRLARARCKLAAAVDGSNREHDR
jgi:RNA polymerase sigma-70 factor (ECF subfamily)